MVGGIIPPPSPNVLILGTCEFVTLCGKRDLAAVIKVKDLRWGDDPELPGGPSLMMWILKIRQSYPAVIREV